MTQPFAVLETSGGNEGPESRQESYVPDSQAAITQRSPSATNQFVTRNAALASAPAGAAVKEESSNE